MIFWLRVFSESRFSGLWFLGFAGEILFGLCRYFLLLCSTFFFSQKKKVAKKSCVFLKWNSPHKSPRFLIFKLRSRAFIRFKQHFSWCQLSAEVLCLRQGGVVCLNCDLCDLRIFMIRSWSLWIRIFRLFLGNVVCFLLVFSIIIFYFLFLAKKESSKEKLRFSEMKLTSKSPNLLL